MAGRFESKLQSSPAVTCMKTLLMVFNFLFWLSGFLILGLGVWMKVELYMYIQLTTVYYSEAPYVLMGVGGGIILVGSLGCLCTSKGHSVLLYVYSFVLLIVFIAELTVGVSGFIYRGKLEEGFEDGLKKAINDYAGKKDAIDGLQKGLKCCGSHSYTDWFAVDWKTPDKTPPNSVPESCCKDYNKCKSERLDNSTAHANIYTDGCFTKVTSFMESNFGIVGGTAIGFAFLQLFGALLACCLAKNINKAKYEQVA